MANLFPVPLKSGSQCDYKSLSHCGLLGGSLAQFSVVAGYVPLWGFGTFQALNPTPYGNGVIAFNQVWPFVYNTMTEEWKDNSGTVVWTVVTQWTGYLDSPISVTTSGPGPSGDPRIIPANFTIVSGTLATATWLVTGGFTGTYKATLTDLFSTTSWASKVSSALGMMGNVALPPIVPGSGNSTIIVGPVTGSPGWATYITNPANPYGGWVIIAAAANGVGVFLEAGSYFESNIAGPNYTILGQLDLPTAGVLPPSGIPANIMGQQSICDIPPASGSSYQANMGAVMMCLTSIWRVSGAGIGTGVFGYDFNHTEVYGQKMDFSGTGGAPNLLAIMNPSAFQSANQVSANSLLYADPFTVAPQMVTFLPADIGANLYSGGTAQYGILGFRSPVQ